MFWPFSKWYPGKARAPAEDDGPVDAIVRLLRSEMIKHPGPAFKPKAGSESDRDVLATPEPKIEAL